MNYRTVSTYFWTDSKVDDEFTPEDKYFFLYLLTNPHTNICGCYEISTKQMERETGYNKDTINRLLERMESYHNVICFNAINKEVLIKNWGKYNWTKSEKLVKAVLSVSKHIKTAEFRNYILNQITEEQSTDNSIQSTEYSIQSTDVSIGYEYPMNKVSKTNKFIKPTIDEVKDYIAEKNYSINADTFWNFYESNGWKVGKNPMKNWKAAVSQWESKNKSNNSNKSKQSEIEGWFNS